MRQNQIALVQCYIHHVKDVEVKISFPHLLRHKQLLYKAHQVALNYFRQ